MEKSELLELADLSRIEIAPEEVDAFLQGINSVESYIKMLDELDLKDVEPLIWLDEEPMDLREDRVRESLDKKDTMRNAPKESYGYFALNNMME